MISKVLITHTSKLKEVCVMSFDRNMKLFEKYYTSQTIKNMSTKGTTYAVYRSRCQCFFKWLEEHYPNSYILDEAILEEIPDILEHFMAYNLEELGNNSKTINNYLTALSSLFIWCVKRRMIPAHPFDKKLDRMKKNCGDSVRESYFLTEEQLTIIKTRMENTDQFSDLDRLSWAILLDTAGRCTAICNIQVKNFVPENGLIMKIREKRGKIVDFIITDETSRLAMKYIQDNDLQPEDYLLARRDRHEPLKGESMRALVRKIGNIVGIPKLYPHSIRKTRINQIYHEHGLDIAAMYANHDNTQTTKDHYIQAKSSRDLRNLVINKR